MPKPHTGYEAFVPELLAVYDEKKNELGIAGVSAADINDALESYNALRAQEVAALEQLALVKGSRFYYSSKAYSLLLEVYARCQCAARTTPAIKRAIAAFAAFMKHNATHKSGAQPVTPTLPPSTSSPSNTGGSGAPTT